MGFFTIYTTRTLKSSKLFDICFHNRIATILWPYRMQLKKLFHILLLGFTVSGFSQNPQLSPAAQISVLTCGSGEELYTTFGHSAFRVQDPNLGMDEVYNYGTFDFNTPNFYLKFARGKLLYTLSKQKFPRFLYNYELENRWVKEQVLNLGAQEKNELYTFLKNNYLPENRDYLYDFFYENCSTKIPDILKKVYGDKLVFNEDHLDNQQTFRDLLRQNLKTNSWSGFGIDLALGSVIDKKASPKEHMFLPLYVFHQFNNSKINNEALVQQERTILDSTPQKNNSPFWSTPLFWLLLLMLLVMTITYMDYKNNTRSRWLDFSLFFGTGIAGLLICFLWFLTDHFATANNFNILWAFPLNSIASFYMLGRKQLPNWLNRYLMFLFGLLVFTVGFWLLKIQIYSPVIIPLWVTLAVRYLFLVQKPQSPEQK